MRRPIAGALGAFRPRWRRPLCCFALVASIFGLPGCLTYPLTLAPEEALHAAVAELAIPADAAVFVGTGDIARCDEPGPPAATAKLLDAVLAAAPQAAVFTTGDHAYADGSAAQFEQCYEPAWGRFNARTLPVPGNHDYETPNAAGYYEYFQVFTNPMAERFDDSPAARRVGYYAFELGGWRVVALNSVIPLSPEATQIAWLEQELGAREHDCLLAYWHNPLFSSGFHGFTPWDSGRDTALFWEILERHGADVILNGHDHLYERFAPQRADGSASADGIREFVIGTGGAGLHPVLRRKRNSVYINNDTFGVLILMLHPASYEWAFLGTDGVVHDRSEQPVACTNSKQTSE